MKYYLVLLITIGCHLAKSQEISPQSTVQYSCSWSNYLTLQQYLYASADNPCWLESTNKAGLRCGGWVLQSKTNNLFLIDITADTWVHNAIARGLTPTNWTPTATQITAIRNLTNQFAVVRILKTNGVPTPAPVPAPIEEELLEP